MLVGYGKVYAIGGFDGHKPTNICEVYDPKMKKWRKIQAMETCRAGAVRLWLFRHFIVECMCIRTDTDFSDFYFRPLMRYIVFGHRIIQNGLNGPHNFLFIFA